MNKISGDTRTYYMPSGLFEYLLVVAPAKEVYKKIMEEKWHFFRNYQQVGAIKTRPQITLSNFLAWDNMENAIIRWLQNIARGQSCFPVTLNNYSGFPSHTVYIRVQDVTAFTELNFRLRAIAPYIKESDCPPARFMQYPHISIAPRLPEAVYENAIKDYSGKEFNASFLVTEFVLLKRKHQFDSCKEVGVFRLLPM